LDATPAHGAKEAEAVADDAIQDEAASDESFADKATDRVAPFDPQLKVALVHDWINGFRGGEKVLLELTRLFPAAPIYCLFYKKGSCHPEIESHEIRPSFLNRLPGADKYYRHFLPLFPLAAETLIDEKYDLIVSTSHAVAKSIATKGAIHWSYVHSPMRYVWDRFDDYFGKYPLALREAIVRPIASVLQCYDVKTAGRAAHYVANSQFIAQRIRVFYNKTAEVIHPPVDTMPWLEVTRAPKDHYLFFSALVPYKQAEMAAQACIQLKKKLVMMGRGPQESELKEKFGKSEYIKFLISPTDEQIVEQFSTARALLLPGIEDFGIVMAEAIIAGLPVIAPKMGGALDIVENGVTGLLFDCMTSGGEAARQSELSNIKDFIGLHLTLAKLTEAIEDFEKAPLHIDNDTRTKIAEKFAPKAFTQKVLRSIKKTLS